MQLGNSGLSDIARSNVKDIINGNGLDPSGQTSIGDGSFEGPGGHAAEISRGGNTSALRSLPYSVVVHAYSNVSLRASLAQSSFEPDSRVEIVASLAQSGIALTNQVKLWAEVRGPQASRARHR